MASKRETWFLAECKTSDGKKKSIWVDRQGSSIYLSTAGSSYGSYLCHSSVSTIEQVKAEIAMVYEVTVTSVKMQNELAREMNQSKPSHSPPDEK
jgi:hypothetical protein